MTHLSPSSFTRMLPVFLWFPINAQWSEWQRKCDGMFFRIGRYLNLTLLIISRLRFPTERSAFLWFPHDVLLLFFAWFQTSDFPHLSGNFASLFEVKSYCQFLDHKAVMYYKLTVCVKNNFTYSYSQDSTSKMYFPSPVHIVPISCFPPWWKQTPKCLLHPVQWIS